jgi:chromosome segregation protein
MQLKQLKLSGFKSFVDPTVVPFSSQLVAVVGPNGCGKSNVIDAVRWVMGEGSAKTLRGESMADVIFNGSSERKPVGQASVELVFDNRFGRFAGQYASYQEIAIKRTVTRDGDSFYFLNGTRCRRRDITDLFLGTGAGTRGYSIIGQNTISQIVEARPEDLRAYLEEAAGVSKYKERRRETLQRINQTREHLSRVQDICGELESQLSRLERQAKAAERYQQLKQEERRCRANILALKWRHLCTEQAQNHQALTQLLVVHEEHQSNVASAVKHLAAFDGEFQATQTTYQSIQTQYYQVGNEVARLQEAQHQQQRELQQLVFDRSQIQNEIQLAMVQLEQDKTNYLSCRNEYNELSQRTNVLKETFEQLSQQYEDMRQQSQLWNHKQHELQAKLNQYQRDVQVEALNKQHLESRYQETLLRIEKNQVEREQFILNSDFTHDLAVLMQQQSMANGALQQATETRQGLIEQGAHVSDQLREVEQSFRAAQDKAQTLTVKHAALEASLHAAMRDKNACSAERLADKPRLVEKVEVEEQWRSVCEWVLGDSLNAIVLDSLDDVLPELLSLTGQPMVCVTPSSLRQNLSDGPRLSDKVQGIKPAWLHSLDSVRAAESIEQALTWLPTLAIDESIVTKEGVWLGRGWLRMAPINTHDEGSLLLRQKSLVELRAALIQAQEQLTRLQRERASFYQLKADNEQALQTAQAMWTECQQALQTSNAQYEQKKQAQEQASLHLSRLQHEQDELNDSLEGLVVDRERFDVSYVFANQQAVKYEQQLQGLLIEKQSVDEALNVSRLSVEEARAALHHAELTCNRAESSAQQLQDLIAREQTRMDTQTKKLDVLNQRYQRLSTPDETGKVALTQALDRHQQLEVELNQAQQLLDTLTSQRRELNQLKLLEEQKDRAIQDNIVQLQLAEQSFIARLDALQESLNELDIIAEQHLKQCSSDLTIEKQEAALLDTSDKIKRLGAINLMAIEEYQNESVRKAYLDEQTKDLNDALMTLESAIAKMDDETLARLQETFTQVNQLFQALFPRLFGGGQARLQLTCDNLLEAGVVVMAQPPGKRNSSIHLLSGGEKAMTAVALVFAIFQLNPSPFCMLDEVDAPLDDLNVGRFCDLVKEMSQQVQFLLITHNKVTMELAEHLIGVTMREPGVSRIVAVDVAEALSLA